jgi:hypothetical protein
MTSVRGINSSGIVAAGGAPRRETPTPRAHVASSRALIPLTPAAPSETSIRSRTHADASFLAHLIATDQRLPQTRERRRAEPQDVIATYTANAQPAAPVGQRLFRVI